MRKIIGTIGNTISFQNIFTAIYPVQAPANLHTPILPGKAISSIGNYPDDSILDLPTSKQLAIFVS